MSLQSNNPNAKALVGNARDLLRNSASLHITDPARALEVATHVREIAEAAGDQDLLGDTLLELGKIVRQRGDLKGAEERFAEAYTLFHNNNNSLAEARALHAIGTIHSASGKFEQASDCFARAIAVVKPSGDATTLQKILNSWGIVYIRIGDYASALKCFEECNESLRTSPDLYLESSVELNIGAIFQRSGDLEIAKQHFQRSLELARELSDNRQATSTLIFLGDTALLENNPRLARSYLNEALALSKSRGYRDLEAHVLKSLAEMAVAMGQSEEALTYLLPAKDLLSPEPDRIFYQKIEQQMVVCYLALKKFDKAAEALKSALRLAEDIGSPQLLYDANVLASELCAKQLDYKQANVHLHEALRQHEILFSESNQKAVREMELRMAIDRRRKEIENSGTTLNRSANNDVASA